MCVYLTNKLVVWHVLSTVRSSSYDIDKENLMDKVFKIKAKSISLFLFPLKYIYIYIYTRCNRGKRQRNYFYPYKPVSWFLTIKEYLFLFQNVFSASVRLLLVCVFLYFCLFFLRITIDIVHWNSKEHNPVIKYNFYDKIPSYTKRVRKF